MHPALNMSTYKHNINVRVDNDWRVQLKAVLQTLLTSSAMTNNANAWQYMVQVVA